MEFFLNASKVALVKYHHKYYFSTQYFGPLSFYFISHIFQSNLSHQTIRVILGNQTCDLDSAVCTLVQGLSEYINAKKHEKNNFAVIPILNIPQKEFRIKTEVMYWLRFHNIPLNLLTFR